MTLGEITLYITTFHEKENARVKEQLSQNYNVAFLTAMFVLQGMNGKPFPTIQEVFPEWFASALPEEEEDKRWMLYKEQMLDFAKAHNKKRQIAKEGETN